MGALERYMELNKVCTIQRNIRCFTSATGPLLFRSSLPLSAEPMKKKKKLDMNIVIQREQKKMRKLEKMIRKQELKGRILKPIDEIEGDRHVLKTLDKRKRESGAMTFEESERRALLHKDWSRYKFNQSTNEMVAISRVIESQSRALQELRNESEELYRKAVQLDDRLFPLHHRGPVETPPIKGYYAPDGEYIDVTKKFDK